MKCGFLSRMTIVRVIHWLLLILYNGLLNLPVPSALLLYMIGTIENCGLSTSEISVYKMIFMKYALNSLIIRCIITAESIL